MPYVQRSADGSVTGIFKQAVPGVAEELLPDNNPEVVALRKLARFKFTPLTLEDEKEWMGKFKVADTPDIELKQLRDSMLSHSAAWSGLETVLSRLFYEILGATSSNIAYAIYFTPTSFDGRVRIVNNALTQFIMENAKSPRHPTTPNRKTMLLCWQEIIEQIDKARQKRNIVAHGAPLTFSVRGKRYARLAAPAFDILRVGNPLSKGNIPGLSAADLKAVCRHLRQLVKCVSDMSKVFSAFRSSELGTLKETISSLRANLKAIHSQ